MNFDSKVSKEKVDMVLSSDEYQALELDLLKASHKLNALVRTMRDLYKQTSPPERGLILNLEFLIADLYQEICALLAKLKSKKNLEVE